MMPSSQALSEMPRQAGFQPKPASEAKRSDIEITEDAAIYRLHPIQDGLDYWKTLIAEHRSSENTEPGGSAPV
jgi:hypothetical protein